MRLRPHLTRTVALLLLATPFAAQVPYDTTADWESYTSGVTTGGAFVDLDGDGYLDLVVANGNDISRQKVEVYTNDGAGNFPINPGWSSTDVDYHGHLSVGDVDRDGFVDVAVSVFLGSGGFGDPGHVKLYANVSGTLESTPGWRSNDDFFSFDCDFGDADADGDLDLAVATGEPYFDPPDQNRIYFNGGTSLATTPGWLSSANDHALGVVFGDADSDGDLDLAFATSLSPFTVFYQSAGSISTTPGWTATDVTSPFGNTIRSSDLDGDGFRELVVSDNDQLSLGTGTFRVYDNASGTLGTSATWNDFAGFVSAVALADVDLDGVPDLAGGVWFGGAQMYLNNGGPFPTSDDWSGTEGSTVEVLVFGDVDRAGIRTETGEVHPANGGRTYYVDHAPVHGLTSVVVDGVTQTANDFSIDYEDGWIALDQTPTSDVVVTYEWSESLDLGVTSWDTSIGNLVYRRYPVPSAIARNDAGGTNPLRYAAAAPKIGTTWNLEVDNTGSPYPLAGVIGYASPLEVPLACCGVLLTNVAHPDGELLALPAGVGNNGVPFSIAIPSNVDLLGLSIASQGLSFGGGFGVQLTNAVDLVVGL